MPALGLKQDEAVVEHLGELGQGVHRRVDAQFTEDVEHLGVVFGQVHFSCLSASN
jgi:hypothetical protein